MNHPPERVVEALERWSELAERGQELSATQLCNGSPELLDELEHHIGFLRRLERLVVPEVDPNETACPAGQSTPSPEGSAIPAILSGMRLGDPVIPNHDILGLLGEGGMGAVYRARDRRLGRIVALKVIKDGLAGSAQVARFQVEAEAVARLNHPHVVQIYEVGRWQPPHGGELPYLSLEYVEGETLERRLGQRAVEPTEAARLLRSLARAVQAAHQKGIVHRDLKPGNVLIAPAADEAALNCAWGWPKLTDFGLARRVACAGAASDETGPTHSGAIVGTPSYMAPEQAECSSDIGPAADVYALGAILYRMLTGRPPFQGSHVIDTLHRVITESPQPPRKLNPALPAELDGLCLRCLVKEPARRATLSELLEGLDRFLSADPTPTAAWRGPAAEVPARRRRNGRRLVAACLVGLIAGLGALSWALRPGRDKKDRIEVPATPPAVVVESAVKPPIKVRRLQVTHYAITPDGKESEAKGAIGETSFAVRFNDYVLVRAELSDPGYLYLIALNANGEKQLLWPADSDNKPLPDSAPTKLTEPLVFPQGAERFKLDDEPRGGWQAFVALASRQPLPPYSEWKKEHGGVQWARQKPGTGVWQVDDKGAHELVPSLGGVRGNIVRPDGAPPLEGLGKQLLVGNVEAVEAIAFPVRAKGAE
jgi:hypothetical protein